MLMISSESPLVSICIPSYNSSGYIKETVTSVLNQSYKNIEVIICDDCSSDGTLEAINIFDDPRLKIYRNEYNLGASGNWNKCLSLATGKYCKLMGADDLLNNEFIGHQVEIFESGNFPNVSLVTSHKNIIDETGKIVMNSRSLKSGEIEGISAVRAAIIRGRNIIGEPVAGLFKREILVETGLYCDDNLYMIDLEFWSRILAIGNLYVLGFNGYSFRISSGSLSSSIGIKQIILFNMFASQVRAKKIYNLSLFDLLISKIMSLVNGLARNLIFFIHNKRINRRTLI